MPELLCVNCNALLGRPKVATPLICRQCMKENVNPLDAYTVQPGISNLRAFLSDLSFNTGQERFSVAAVRHHLPETFIDDMTGVALGYMVWREQRGWVLTERGIEFVRYGPNTGGTK